jgi:hypothetical protein
MAEVWAVTFPPDVLEALRKLKFLANNMYSLSTEMNDDLCGGLFHLPFARRLFPLFNSPDLMKAIHCMHGLCVPLRDSRDGHREGGDV